MISGTFYLNDIKGALQMFGPLTVAEIKTKLLMRNVKLDETHILDALEVLLKQKAVRKSDVPGKYVRSHLS